MVVTMRCFQSRFLLRPGERVNALIKGVIARAQLLYGMAIHDLVVMSNHVHLYLCPRDHEQLEAFQRHIGSNLSKEIGAEISWEGGIFHGRYSSVPVTDEEKAQVERLAYLLAHGVKEGLVRRPQDWPGVAGVKQLMKGKMRIRGGRWIDRSGLYRARRAWEANQRSKNRRVRHKEPRKIDYTHSLEIVLSPIPCWQGYTREQFRKSIEALLESIQTKYAHLIAQVPEDWKKRILRRDPHPRPENTKRTPKPLCHAATRQARFEFWEQYHAWVSSYMQASERLRSGIREALGEFPAGCHLPRLNAEVRKALEAPS